MKFGNGCWLQKEGIECFAPQEAYFVTKKENEVVICAPRRYTGRNQSDDPYYFAGRRSDPCADKSLSRSGRSWTTF